MLQHWMLFCLILIGSTEIFAQDERYYRRILTGDLPVTVEPKESFVRSYLVEGPEYLVDLDGDGIEEIIRPDKKDGLDHLTIMNSTRGQIFSAKLFASGGESVIYKLRLVNISTTVKALLIFLDEGTTKGHRLESTAKIFILSFENNNLSNISFNPGPHIYHEREAQRDQYFRREFQVDVRDLNGDGKREVVVHMGHIQHIYEYLEKGEWTKF